MKKKISISTIILILIFTILAFPAWAGQEALSFERALNLVFEKHPLLRTFVERERAVALRAAQAARLENPEITFSLEDVFGSGEFGGVRSSETTLELAQTLPLFGKRQKRREALLANREVLRAAFEEVRLKLFRETARAFAEALYAQRKVKLYEELVGLSQKLLKVTEAKFLAGKIPETEKIRAEIVASETEVRLTNAREELRSALSRLARLWNGPPPAAVSGDFFQVATLPTKFDPERHPRTKRFLAEIERLEKEIALARAEILPDVTVSAGVRWYNESDERAYLFGLSLPLPLWNRNQDQIAALRREITAVRLDLRSEELVLRREFTRVKSALDRVLREIYTLENELLPRAREIYRRNLEAYRFGKMEFLRVLDAQRTLFELRLSRLEAYRRYHELRTEALYLLVRPAKNFL